MIPVKNVLAKDQLQILITGVVADFVGAEILNTLQRAADSCENGVALVPYEVQRGDILWADAYVVLPDRTVDICPVLSLVLGTGKIVTYAETKIGSLSVVKDENKHKTYIAEMRNGVPLYQGLGLYLVDDESD